MTDSLWALPSPDVAASLARNPTVVLPFGSVEQHGPHLPCGTDTMIAERLAEAVAGRLDALYAPFGPYGVTPIHAGRPGTAALDVFAQEPVDASVFAGVAERVILTPHMAWYTEESEHDLRVKAAQEARRLLEGERPRDVVVAPEAART